MPKDDDAKACYLIKAFMFYADNKIRLSVKSSVRFSHKTASNYLNSAVRKL